MRAQRFRDRDLFAPPPQLEHDFLRHVLRRRAIAQHALCERHEVRIVRTKHGIERGLVARLQSFEKVAVIHVISVRSWFQELILAGVRLLPSTAFPYTPGSAS